MDHRRPSYASVVGGSSSGGGNNAAPARAGAFANLANFAAAATAARAAANFETEQSRGHPLPAISSSAAGSPFASNSSASGIFSAGAASFPPATNDLPVQSINPPSSWGKTASSSGPKHWGSHAMSAHANEKSMGHTSMFLRPSYLRGTRYMEKLEAAQRAKVSMRRESTGFAAHHHTSNGGSLSTSSSSISLHKMAPSHRGMTYEIIESAPLPDEEAVPLLPSQWKEHDRTTGLEISPDGLELKCTAAAKSQEHDAAAARTDFHMPSQCGIYYYEVTMLRKGKEGMVAVGFSGSKVALDRLPGWEPDSWAYHSDDGKSYCCQVAGKNYGPLFSVGDIIGCGINFRTNTAFFTKNGVDLGVAFKELKDTKLFPSVGMKKVGMQVRLNFGQSPFMFDIDGMMLLERQKIQEEINSTSIETLLPSIDESTLIKELVNQLLRHDGYVNTVEAFAEETSVENTALQQETMGLVPTIGIKEDVDAINRQRIRSAVLDGDIDRALKLTNTHYPNVLDDNPNIGFRLRCRKFVEMMRLSHEPMAKGRLVAPNGHSASDEIFAQEMELDEPSDVPDDWDEMDTEDGRINGTGPTERMRETMDYGMQLRTQYNDDRTKEQALSDIFSLFAYQDLKNSPAAPILDASGRIPVAEELNSAILVSLGKSSAAALEKIYRQTETLIEHYLSDQGGPGAFVNISQDVLR